MYFVNRITDRVSFGHHYFPSTMKQMGELWVRQNIRGTEEKHWGDTRGSPVSDR